MTECPHCDRAHEALDKILQWAQAYPLDVFPEPDFKRVHEVLKAAGLSLDQVSASNMRHVVNGVARLAREGLPVTTNAAHGAQETGAARTETDRRADGDN